MAEPAARPREGILWMVATGLLFIGMTASVRLAGPEVPAAQSAFLRFALALPLLLPLWRPLRAARLTARHWRLVGLRALVHTGAVVLWFYAMTRVPLAEITALNYLNPVYVTLGAALLLGERFALRRGLAILAAVAGALIVLRPGFREIGAGHLAMLFASVLFAGSYLVAKRQTSDLPAPVIVGLLSVTVTLGLAPFAAVVWVPPGAAALGWLALATLLATLAHYAMTRAFAAAPVSVTQPAAFLQLIWATALGAIAFAEPVDGWVILGGALIVAAVSYIAWRESRTAT